LKFYPQNLFAVSDVEGELWSKNYKDGHEMEAAPFYLIYQGLSQRHRLQMALQLDKIHLVPTIGNVSLLISKDDPALKLGLICSKNCISCHAINKGSMGPELNYPKSVTSIGIKNN
jgi:hypothetical protein